MQHLKRMTLGRTRPPFSDAGWYRVLDGTLRALRQVSKHPEGLGPQVDGRIPPPELLVGRIKPKGGEIDHPAHSSSGRILEQNVTQISFRFQGFWLIYSYTQNREACTSPEACFRDPVQC